MTKAERREKEDRYIERMRAFAERDGWKL